MRTSSRRRTAAVAAAVLLALGCGHKPEPRGGLIDAKDLAHTAFGGFIEVTLTNGAQTRGELIAIGPGDRIYVLSNGALVAAPIASVKRAILGAYRTHEDSIGTWGALGTISTISHGFFLIFSAPIWLVSTGAAAHGESTDGYFEYPDVPLARFALFARFPQGMPPGMTEAILLHGRPPPPVPAPTSAPTSQPTAPPPAQPPTPLPAQPQPQPQPRTSFPTPPR